MKSFIRLILASGVLFSAAAVSASARDWTLSDGVTVQGDFAGMGGDFVFLKQADGRRQKFPLASFSVDDRQFIKDHQRGNLSVVKTDPAVAAKAKAAAQAKNAPAAMMFGHKLVVPGGEGFTVYPASETKPDYYAIYFSAGWCGPCHAFTPKLVDFYQKQKPQSGRFEVVFVSLDHSENDMLGYMKQFSMPWPALRFDDARAADIRRYAGKGIPCLVIVDAQGKVLAHSYEKGEYVGPSKPMDTLGRLLASKQ